MGKQWLTLFLGAPKSLQMVIAAMELKDAYSLEEKYLEPSNVKREVTRNSEFHDSGYI